MQRGLACSTLLRQQLLTRFIVLLFDLIPPFIICFLHAEGRSKDCHVFHLWTWNQFGFYFTIVSICTALTTTKTRFKSFHRVFFLNFLFSLSLFGLFPLYMSSFPHFQDNSVLWGVILFSCLALVVRFVSGAFLEEKRVLADNKQIGGYPVY